MKIRPLIFAAICGLGFLSVSCSDGTSETVSDNVIVDPQEEPQQQQSATVSVPLLGQSFAVTKGSTSVSEVSSARESALQSCAARYDGINFQNCRAQVLGAYQQALAFLNS